MRKCVVVLGMHRSGTSALAGLLSLLGADPGTRLMPTTEFNPKGYWELQSVFDLNEILLAHLDRRWHDVAPLPPDWNSRPDILDLLPRAVEIIVRELSGSKLCVLKDPRFCLLLPFWAGCLSASGFELRHIVVVRSPQDTAASLKTRDQFSVDKCTWLWLRYMLDAEHSTRGKIRAFLSFDDLLADWSVPVAKLSKKFDLPFSITPKTASKVESFLDPQLRHFHDARSNHSEIAKMGGALRQFGAETYAVMRKASGRDLSKKDMVALDDVRQRFEVWSADHIVAEIMHEQAATRSVVFGLNDCIAGMRSAAATAAADIANQRTELEELALVCAQGAASLEVAQRSNAELEATLDELSSRRAGLETQLDAAKQRQVLLEDQLSSSSARNTELQATNNEVIDARSKLQMQIDVAMQQRNLLEGRLGEASARNAELEGSLRELREHSGQLEVQLGAAAGRERTLADRLAALSEQRVDLQSRLQAADDHGRRMQAALREALAFHQRASAKVGPRGLTTVILPRDETALDGVRFALDRPENGKPLTGEIEIAGWCLGTECPVVAVEISWNETRCNAEYGILRNDVGQAYPDCPSALASGFRCVIEAKPGDYLLGIAALCSNGQRVVVGEGIISVQPNPLERSLDAPKLNNLRAETLRFAGWCFSRDQVIAGLILRVGDTSHPCTYGIARADVATAFREVAHAERSGFQCDVPLAPGRFDLSIEATLENGERIIEILATGIRVRRALGFKRAVQRVLEQLHRLRHTWWHAARWARRQRRLPRWHEWPLLLRKARTQLQAPTSDGDLQPPTGWHLPPPVEPYDVWLKNNAVTPRSLQVLRERLAAAGSAIPLISVVMPVFKPNLKLLERAINSVQDQALTKWELCIADDGSFDARVRSLLQAIASRDERIQFVLRDVNGNVSAATNSAASLARGTFLLFLDQDDELSSDALGEIALHLAEHPDTDLLYSDDDKIDGNGHRYAPQFKPAWSPELLLSYMYLGHALVVRRELFEQLGGFRTGYEGSQDYDFALRASEVVNRVGHIPRVLYHWRATPGSTATNADAKPGGYAAGERALQEALVRRHSRGRAVRPNWAQRDRLSLYAHEFDDEGPSVTVIIPTFNNHANLRRCLDSLATTTYRNLEIVLAAGDSDDAATRAYLRTLPHRVIAVPNLNGRRNSATRNNLVAAAAGGEYLLFLHGDTEVLEPRWLSRMVGYARLTGVGAVGAHLVDPDGRTVHAGIVQGLYDGLAGPAFRLMPQTDHGYLYYAMVARNCSAVAAACMLTPRQLFIALGGFDEHKFSVAYSDVDYCFRLTDAGYRCVYAPGAKLMHHEGFSRGFDDAPQEVAAFRAKYRTRIDPYYSPHLSLDNEQFAISPRRLPCLSGSRAPVRALMCAFTLNLEGAPYSQFELTLALKQARVIEPVVYAPLDGPLRAEYERHGIRVHVFEHPLRGAVTLAQYEEAIAKFSHWVKAQEAEVLYANTLETFYAIDAARGASVPSIWNIRESEPWQTYHRYLSPEVAARALDCFVFPYQVIFVAHATRERYAALATRHQFTVIHNGLNMERLASAARRWPRSQARAQLGLAEGETMLLVLGTICERKGQLDLVEAFALLEPRQSATCRCFIVGDRPGSYSTRLNQRVQDLARTRGLRISIVPETDETALYYRAADIFICTSRVESYPRVILEAMAYDLPIVTTPVFGVREQVIPEVNSIFYEPGDFAALRGALDRLLNDGKLRMHLAGNAKAVLGTLTSFEEMVARYGRIFVEAAECQATLVSPGTARMDADAPHMKDQAPPLLSAAATAEGHASLQDLGD